LAAKANGGVKPAGRPRDERPMHSPLPLAAEFAARPRLILSLPARDRESGEWRLAVSPEMARFIGAYARLPGIAAPGGVIRYQAAA